MQCFDGFNLKVSYYKLTPSEVAEVLGTACARPFGHIRSGLAQSIVQGAAQTYRHYLCSGFHPWSDA